MKPMRVKQPILIFICVFLCAIFLWRTAARTSANRETLSRQYDGLTQLNDSALQLEMAVSPSVAAVGDVLTIELTLTNGETAVAAPQLTIQLPDTLRFDLRQVSRGTSINLQDNSLSWQPVISPNGATAQKNIQLTVNGIDPTQPEQTITAILRHADRVEQTAITIWAGTAPEGTLTISPPRASVGQPVQFTGQAAGSGPFTQTWLTGDGRVIPAENPVVVYPLIGTYEVGLQVANPLAVDTSSAVLVVVPEPASFFTLSDTSPAIGQEIQFMSQSGGQPPLTYIWDFGDGSISTLPNPTHQYNIAGTYNVQLTISNEYGQASNYLPITVGQPPTADFSIEKAAAVGVPLSAQAFVDETVTNMTWDMGDGNTHEGAAIQHTYVTPGQYTVLFTAINQFGETVITRAISVAPGTLYTYLPTILTAGEPPTDTLPITQNIQNIQTDTPLPIIDTSTTIEFTDNTIEVVLTEDPTIDALSPSEQLTWYINDARLQAGLAPVQVVPVLSMAAKQHTNDMATAGFTSHTGSDGSPPYERIARVGFRGGGYAGETTAWGFRTGREAVQFWLESPPHRAILLNPIADHVGVAQTTNYNAPSVWYWTAEFASSYGSIEAQMQEAGVRLVYPEGSASYEFNETIPFRWSWPLPLDTNGRFIINIVNQDGSSRQIGLVNRSAEIESVIGTPQEGTLFALSELVNNFIQQAGEYFWQIQLEDGRGNLVTQSEQRSLIITGSLPTITPTPLPTIPPTLPATQTPTATSSPTLAPTSLPKATVTPIPVLTQQASPTAPTQSETATPEFTPTITETPTITPTPSNTPTPSSTPTPSATPTNTPTPTPTLGVAPSSTPTPSP